MYRDLRNISKGNARLKLKISKIANEQNSKLKLSRLILAHNTGVNGTQHATIEPFIRGKIRRVLHKTRLK